MFRSLVSPRRNNSLADGRQDLSQVLPARRAVSPRLQVSPPRAISTTSPTRGQMVTFSYSNKPPAIQRIVAHQSPQAVLPQQVKHYSPMRVQQAQIIRSEPPTIVVNTRQPTPTVVRVVR